MAALFLYPIWLFTGLFSITFLLLQLRSWLEDKWSRFALALIVAGILTGVIWLPSVHAYTQYKTNRVLDAAHTFVISTVETSNAPEDFLLEGDIDSFSMDANKPYELGLIDNLLGVYEFTVKFSNGREYDLNLSERRRGWHIYITQNRDKP